MQPQVEIDVDGQTGIWYTDGLPMLYIPRHFMVNVHDGVEAALGRENYRRVLHDAGHRSAYYWCQSQAERYNISAFETVEHYLQRLSVRGWGQFHLQKLALDPPQMTIILKNSIYVLAHKGKATHTLCYMFEGFFTGAMHYFMRSDGVEAHGFESGGLICREIECQAMGFECCRFEIEAKTAIEEERS